jgi:hypothetical protein
MNIDINEYNKLKLINEELLKKNKELEEKLKSYTNPERHKRYYEKNSDIVKEKARNYMEKIKETNPEKLKEWRHQAYLNRKAKLKTKEDNINNNF